MLTATRRPATTSPIAIVSPSDPVGEVVFEASTGSGVSPGKSDPAAAMSPADAGAVLSSGFADEPSGPAEAGTPDDPGPDPVLPAPGPGVGCPEVAPGLAIAPAEWPGVAEVPAGVGVGTAAVGVGPGVAEGFGLAVGATLGDGVGPPTRLNVADIEKPALPPTVQAG